MFSRNDLTMLIGFRLKRSWNACGETHASSSFAFVPRAQRRLISLRHFRLRQKTAKFDRGCAAGRAKRVARYRTRRQVSYKKEKKLAIFTDAFEAIFSISNKRHLVPYSATRRGVIKQERYVWTRGLPRMAQLELCSIFLFLTFLPYRP